MCTCIFDLYFCYPRKLSTIIASPLSGQQHIIKWLPTPFYAYGTVGVNLTPPPPVRFLVFFLVWVWSAWWQPHYPSLFKSLGWLGAALSAPKILCEVYEIPTGGLSCSRQSPGCDGTTVRPSAFWADSAGCCTDLV